MTNHYLKKYRKPIEISQLSQNWIDINWIDINIEIFHISCLDIILDLNYLDYEKQGTSETVQKTLRIVEFRMLKVGDYAQF